MTCKNLWYSQATIHVEKSNSPIAYVYKNTRQQCHSRETHQTLLDITRGHYKCTPPSTRHAKDIHIGSATLISLSFEITKYSHHHHNI